MHNGGTYTTVANTNKTLQGLANERLARCLKTKHQSVKGITRADFGPFIIRKKNIRKQIKLSHIPPLGKLFDIARKAPAGAEESRAHESDAGATRATDHKETMCVSHTHVRTTRFAEPLPMMHPSPNPRWTSCFHRVSNKKKKKKTEPGGLSDQKLQWSVSPLDALPRVCAVIRKSR